MEEGNYSRYKGGDGQKGEKKDTILSQIVALLHAEGLTHRDKNTVGAKITAIEGQFRKAKEWLANTGQGLQDDGDEDSIKKYVNKICPYFEELGDIMMDKPSIYANITSDSLESPQPSRHVRSASLSSCSSTEASLKRPRDGGLSEQLSKLSTELVMQNSKVEEQRNSTKVQKMELPKRREMREERKERDETMLRKLQKKKLEVELERERMQMQSEHLALLAATVKQRKELVDNGWSKEEVDSVLPLPVPPGLASTESVVMVEDDPTSGRMCNGDWSGGMIDGGLEECAVESVAD
jgi:hypothetical protein